MDNSKIIGYLLKKETDLVSSINLAPLQEINVFCQNSLLLDNLILMAELHCFKKQNQPFFLSISLINNETLQEVENVIDKMKDFEFILFNTDIQEEKTKILKKYAPMSKITYLIP